MPPGVQQQPVQSAAPQVPAEPSAPSPSGTRIYERLAEPQDPEPHQPPPQQDPYRAAYEDYDDEPYDDFDDEPYDEPPPRPRRRSPPRSRRYEDEYDDYEDEPRAPRRSEPREESQVDYQRKRDRRSDRINVLANVIYVATGLITTVFVLHIVFTLFGANASSGFVSFVYQTSKVFVLGFGDVFQPGDATIGLVLNYGLAALVYWVVGRLIARALKRR